MGLTVCLTGVLLNRSFELARNDSPFMSCPEDWFTTAEAQVRASQTCADYCRGLPPICIDRLGGSDLCCNFSGVQNVARTVAVLVVVLAYAILVLRNIFLVPEEIGPAWSGAAEIAVQAVASAVVYAVALADLEQVSDGDEWCDRKSEAEGLWVWFKGDLRCVENTNVAALVSLSFYVCISTLLCSVISAQLHFAHPSGPPPQEEQRSTVRIVIPDDIVVSGPSAAKNV